jgi:SAM-dependent methyltransferase
MWDQKYNVDHYIYGKEPNDFLVQQLHHIPKKGNVLCLAEGEGRNAVYLAKQGFSVTAVDSSEVGIEKAKKLASQNGVEINFILADLKDFDMGLNKFDAIISIFCHVDVPLRINLHKSVVQSLKLNGVFILEAYSVDQLNYKTGGPKVQEELMSIGALNNELRGLKFFHLLEKTREVHEGPNHFGLAAVVQVVASKL